MEIVVHRGANDVAPENTMAAARACVDLGADYVEIDVWRSLDGEHYIMHDPTLNRTTNGSGPIALRMSRYIDRLDAGSWFAPQFAGERVPRLEAFLDWARGRTKVYLDVKTGSLRRIVRMIREHGMEAHVFFWFPLDSTARRFRTLAPDIPLKMNSRTPEEVRRHKERFDHQIVEQGPNEATSAVATVCRELGIKMMANVFGKRAATADELRALYRRVVEADYDMVNLDRPGPFVEFLHAEGLR
ncbi:MAG: glycerophosphodiester phosphodiesterase family protein [Spirochaetales bacterium]|nr:glycerophosphodiester phosphodiesterase family protein [Spirochaetales bacterium]